jgi:hypothetical protein
VVKRWVIAGAVKPSSNSSARVTTPCCSSAIASTAGSVARSAFSSMAYMRLRPVLSRPHVGAIGHDEGVCTGRILRATISASLAALALGGCGGVQSPDLFAVSRDGGIPGARLDLIVSDNGTMRCNGRAGRLMPNQLLLDAREVKRLLAPDAKRGLTIAQTGNAVLTYSVRDEDGHVSFPDTAAASRPGLARLALFTRQSAQQVCGLRR